MRAFIFAVWIAAGKTAAASVKALEALSAQHYTVAEKGGRQMVSATVQGKSFTYEIPEGMDSTRFAHLAYEAWKAVETGGTDSARMTDAQLETYLKDASGEVTNTLRARFAPRGAGLRQL